MISFFYILLMSFGISVQSPAQPSPLRSYQFTAKSNVIAYHSSTRLYRDFKTTTIDFGGGKGWDDDVD